MIIIYCCNHTVDENTKQPLGLLHGGATAALAESLGSVGSWLCIETNLYKAVGIKINYNHICGKKDGVMTGTARPLHLGKTAHIWNINITDEGNHLIAVSRLTVAIIKNKK